MAGGGGLGMLVSGLLVPSILEAGSIRSWPLTWLVMAGASESLWPVVCTMRAMPPPAAPAPGAPGANTAGQATLLGAWPALASYAMFAIGYLAYLTFLVAWMREQGVGSLMIALAWALLSLLVIASPFVWRGLLSRARAGGAIAAANAVTAVAVALPLWWPGIGGMLASAMIFGLAFFVVPTAATTFCRRYFDESQWPGAMAVFTLVFAAGQVLGPVAAGMIADHGGDLGGALAGASGVLFAGAVIALWQRPAIASRA
ncbi:MAG: YbfB/YjiJ family MFS transporter [Burkholderiaceae bacterium]